MGEKWWLGKCASIIFFQGKKTNGKVRWDFMRHWEQIKHNKCKCEEDVEMEVESTCEIGREL